MRSADEVELLSNRVTGLETLFTHLERQLAELNQIVIAQMRRLDLIQKELEKLRSAEDEDDFGFEGVP